MAKPFLKWVGGKKQLLTDLNRLAPEKYNRYFEPFIGGGAFLFSLEPENAVINDYNPHLAELYIDIRDNITDVIAELKNIEEEYLKLDHEGRRSLFYEYRSIYNMIESSITKSALLIFLNKTCFNGVYRENPNGDFNVPFGRNNLTSIFDESTLNDAANVLKNCDIQSGSYELSIADADTGDFVYLDPPYVPLSVTASFTKYTGKGFGFNEQKALRDHFLELVNRGCFVMLSNSNTQIVRELYRDFHINEVLANRAVNCKANGRGKIKELVITNYPCTPVRPEDAL